MHDWQNRQKTPSGHHRTTLLGYIFAIKALSIIGKNLLNTNVFPTCPHNMVNFGLLVAEICWRVWITPANFNGFHFLAALLHNTLLVGLSQTLWHWAEGTTYIWQGDHHVGHWPIFPIFFSFWHTTAVADSGTIKVVNDTKCPTSFTALDCHYLRRASKCCYILLVLLCCKALRQQCLMFIVWPDHSDQSIAVAFWPHCYILLMDPVLLLTTSISWWRLPIYVFQSFKQISRIKIIGKLLLWHCLWFCGFVCLFILFD